MSTSTTPIYDELASQYLGEQEEPDEEGDRASGQDRAEGGPQQR